MLTLPQAARQLAVSERTLRREIADGRLVAVRIRSAYRIRPEDLARYLEAAACPSEKSASDGRFDCASAVASALNALYPAARPEPTRARSKIRSAAPTSTRLRVVGPTGS
jgi:excisionase family DNA binding protein